MAAVSRAGPWSPTGNSWSKWQVAVVVGAPLAVAGVSYWYYRKSGKNRTRNISGTSANGNPTSKTPSMEGPDNTIETIEAMIANEKDSLKKAQLYKNEGNKLFKAGKYDDAINMYTKAIEACPSTEKSDVFYQNRAAAYEQLRNYSKVIEDCSVALELNPRYTKALQRRAKALEQTEELEQCLEDVTAACILEAFQNQSSIVQADRVLKALGRKHAKEAMKHRKPHMPSKYFIRTFLSAFSEDPLQKMIKSEYPPERLKSEDLASKKGFEKAKHAFAIGDYDQIVAACSEEIDSVEADGGSTMAALLLRGTFYLWLGEMKNAAADLEAVIENEMADKKLRVNALIKRASLHVQMDDPNRSFDDFERAANLDPENSDVYHHRGQMNLLLEKAEEAKQDFARAVELNPTFPIAYVQKCYIDYRFGSMTNGPSAFKNAQKAFEEAIQKFPDCQECYMLYAQVLNDKGNFEDADKYFEKAMKLDPSNATLVVHRGLLQLQWKNDVDKALKFIEEAINIDNKCEFAYETLGTIEVQRGNLKRAVELFDKAIPLSKTEFEMSHLYALRDAAVAQDKVATKLGLSTGL
ncbi:Mitochondrial import receptor subunit TOM70 [Frankliniella fusca]|uniref:Mitochondrial import receptor subunit TOM70 n=1 Tax=Frankliniella fusca TaxID=407009 RepID=A0AAE1LPJ1_9NEOP|nr:Mitochondrial import receptor subunit TOM70 [Frankliniella fusca]